MGVANAGIRDAATDVLLQEAVAAAAAGVAGPVEKLQVLLTKVSIFDGGGNMCHILAFAGLGHGEDFYLFSGNWRSYPHAALARRRVAGSVSYQDCCTFGVPTCKHISAMRTKHTP